MSATYHRGSSPYALRYIDFDGENTSAVVHDLLMSYLHRYSQSQGASRDSVLARDELLEGAVTSLLQHFTFASHDYLDRVDICISLKVRQSAQTVSGGLIKVDQAAVRTWLNKRVTNRDTGVVRELDYMDEPHIPSGAIRALAVYGKTPAFHTLRSPRRVASMATQSQAERNRPFSATAPVARSHRDNELSSLSRSHIDQSRQRIPPQAATTPVPAPPGSSPPSHDPNARLMADLFDMGRGIIPRRQLQASSEPILASVNARLHSQVTPSQVSRAFCMHAEPKPSATSTPTPSIPFLPSQPCESASRASCNPSPFVTTDTSDLHPLKSEPDTDCLSPTLKDPGKGYVWAQDSASPRSQDRLVSHVHIIKQRITRSGRPFG
jgi:hypothetical protein